MSKNLFRYCLCLVAAASLVLVSCSKETETETVTVYTPQISVGSAVLQVSYEGGPLSFTYAVANAAEGGAVSCSANVAWLSDYDYSTEGTVAFTVAANSGEEGRLGVITLTYVYDGGSVSQSVVVAQGNEAGDYPEVADVPVLSVDTPVVQTTYEGGSSSFKYSVENPADGGAISCSADEDWISDYGYSTDGTVTFTVAANSGEKGRLGVITVTYTYNDGALSQSVVVAQGSEEGDYPEVAGAPVLSISSAYAKVTYEGGSSSLTYSVENPADDGEISCKADVDWISEYDYSTDGTVAFNVAANEGDEGRLGAITVTYTHSGGEISQYFVVAQGNEEGEYPDTPETAAPSIELAYESMEVAYVGGPYYFTYVVNNPVDGGEISCTTDADWITDFTYPALASVKFEVTAQSGVVDAREGTITVTYTYGDEAVSATLTVSQRGHGWWDGTISGLVGSYIATAYNAGYGDEPFGVYIYPDDTDESSFIMDIQLYLFVANEYSYPTSDMGCVTAQLGSEEDTFEIYGQANGYYFTSGMSRYYYWWVLCSGYNGSSWSYSSSLTTPCVFKYDVDSQTFVSDDYGLMFAYSTSNSSPSLNGLYDGFTPPVVLTRVGDDPNEKIDFGRDEETDSIKQTSTVGHDVVLDASQAHTNFRLAK